MMPFYSANEHWKEINFGSYIMSPLVHIASEMFVRYIIGVVQSPELRSNLEW